MPFTGSYVWKVRQKYGHNLLLLPAASVVVERDDGAILLMKRADIGTWAIMGGYAEEGAGFRQTAITELEEEAAIKADEADLIPFATLSDPTEMHISYPNGDEVHPFVHSFIIRKWEKLDQKLDEEEVTDLRFFSLDEITDDLMSSTTRMEINAYREYLRTDEFQSQ
jgi:8-oxo-dGTP pyrophosphatase MutT (NUDIX family)